MTDQQVVALMATIYMAADQFAKQQHERAPGRLANMEYQALTKEKAVAWVREVLVIAKIFEVTYLEHLMLLRELVDRQAEDDGLWFEATTAPEAYLQQALRKLHRLVENPPRNEP